VISCVAQDFGGFDINGAVWWVEPLPHARFCTVSYCCHSHHDMLPRHAGQQMNFIKGFIMLIAVPGTKGSRTAG